MLPTLRPATDEILISPIDDLDDLRELDIVAVRDRDGNLLVHRLIKKDGDQLLLRGDGNVRNRKEETVAADQVIGVVTEIRRDGRLLPDPRSDASRREIARWLRLPKLLRRLHIRLLTLLNPQPK